MMARKGKRRGGSRLHQGMYVGRSNPVTSFGVRRRGDVRIVDTQGRPTMIRKIDKQRPNAV